MPIDKAKALKLLADEVGYREGPSANQQKYSPAVPGLEWSNFQPWCQTFQSWVDLRAGGTPGKDFPLTASCLSAVSWARSRGRLHTTPKVGDYVMYGTGGGTHVERIVAISGSVLTVIGGNTSGSLGGTYWNGNGVFRKQVNRSNTRIFGYVRPVYGTAGGGMEDDMVGLKEGDTGERVKFLQELLTAAGHKLGEIDGDYGPATAKAVLAARRAEGSKQQFGDEITGAAAKQILSRFIKATVK